MHKPFLYYSSKIIALANDILRVGMSSWWQALLICQISTLATQSSQSIDCVDSVEDELLRR